MSPYLARPLRSYAEAAADVVANSTRYGMRLTDERLALLEIIERELKRRDFLIKLQAAIKPFTQEF